MKQKKLILKARNQIVSKLKILNRQMGDLTEKACIRCPKKDHPSRCCDDLMCLFVKTKLEAKGIILQETGNPHARFLGPKGCVIPPEYRPVCSAHLCQKIQKTLITEQQENYLRWQNLQKKIDVLQGHLIKANETLEVDEGLKDLPF